MDAFIGQIGLFPWSFAAKNWALCDGTILPISQYTALYSLLGTAFGGNGQTNFGLPDMRGRTPVHVGSTYTHTGQQAGAEMVTLSITNLPAHTHQFYGTNVTTATEFVPAAGVMTTDNSASFYAADTSPLTISGQSLGAAGNSQPHSNLQPYTTINFSIALVGYYPSRN